MAYVPPVYPQRETDVDTTLTQEDQRVFIVGDNAVTVTLPDAAESFRLSRRFVIINRSTKTANMTGSMVGSEQMMSVPPNMFREAIASPNPDGTYSFVATAPTNAESRGMHIEDDKGNRVANARTAHFEHATIAASNGSSVIVTPDPITGIDDNA